MTFALWLLLVAPHPEVVLANEVVQVATSEWRQFNFTVSHVPQELKCTFAVVSPPGAVRLAVLSRRDLQHFAMNQPYGFIRASVEASNGTLPVIIREPGDYSVLIINSSLTTHPSQVHLFVAEEFPPVPPAPAATYLSERRKLITLLISFISFFAMLSWSANRLLRAMKRSH